MAPFLWLYIALYSGLSVWGIREDVVQGAPSWKAISSTVGNALGIGGMIVWVGGLRSPEIQALWTWVFPLLLLQAAVEARFEYRVRLGRLLPDADLEDAQMRSLMATSLVIGVLLAIPFFLINYWVAYADAA